MQGVRHEAGSLHRFAAIPSGFAGKIAQSGDASAPVRRAPPPVRAGKRIFAPRRRHEKRAERGYPAADAPQKASMARAAKTAVPGPPAASMLSVISPPAAYIRPRPRRISGVQV